MRILLDTHFVLWWLADDAALGDRARELISAPENLVFFSAASVWEIWIKQAIGKLDLPSNFIDVLDQQSFEPLPVTTGHAHGVRELPMHHRDPFDRMLIAQARSERLTLLTRDQVVAQYDVMVELA